MPIWRLQSEFAADSTLPRDYLTITPHFNDQGVGSDPQGLCDDLAAALDGFAGTGNREIRVTAYDAQGTKPVYPEARAVINTGSAPASGSMRELAICLSFYSVRNVPRQRGRLYIPHVVCAAVSSTVAVRPSDPQRTNVGSLAQVFSDLGGVDVDWCVWSRTNAIAYPITNWWVDDEWDVIRSRGLRSTTRTQGTVSDG